jgi:uncharacterized BrkB/YihY/UPF0761 family membrane protein
MFKSLIRRADGWQRGHRVPAVAYGVVKKFSDDEGSLLVVGLGWYGFVAIYPLLLVVVTIFAFVGVASLGHGIVSTLHDFPVIGSDFSTSKGGKNLHGSILGLIVGLVGLIYGAQGVTQVAIKALSRVWNLPSQEQLGFVPRLGRSVAGLVIIGLAFLTNAFVGSVATGIGRGWVVRILLILALLVINVVFYAASFRVLTPNVVATRQLVPGAAMAAVFFTLLITVGTGLIDHELRGESATYGAFASVIGVVAFLFLLAKLTLYAAELNPVLALDLFPRSITGEPTEADLKVTDLRMKEEARKPSATVTGADGSAASARRPDPEPA